MRNRLDTLAMDIAVQMYSGTLPPKALVACHTEEYAAQLLQRIRYWYDVFMRDDDDSLPDIAGFPTDVGDDITY